MGQVYWPTPDAAFPGTTDSGTVESTSIDDDDLTVTCNRTQSWGVAAGGACGDKRWVGYHCTPCPLSPMPSQYDLIVMVDFYEPRTHIRMPITDQVDPEDPEDLDSTGQLIVDVTNAKNAVTAGYIDSLDDLNGKEYYIQKRGGAWITDRWPQRPDDQQLWIKNGSSATGQHFGDDEDTDYVKLEDSDPLTAWATDRWVGCELMVFNGPVLKRIPIVHNDQNALYLTQNDDSTGISGDYSIVEVGKKCTPGRPVWHYGVWVAGLGDVAAGHTPDDDLTTVAVPRRTFEYNSGDPCGTGIDCGEFPRTETIFDKDYQVGFDDICAGSYAGNYVNRSVWKSLRMLQIDIEQACNNFLPVLGEGDTDEGKAVINPYTPATLFRDMGCPSGTATTDFTVTDTDEDDNESGYYSFTVTADPFAGHYVRWAIKDTTGAFIATGSSVPGSDNKISGFFGNVVAGTRDDTKIGLSVVYSLPWLRVRPRWIRTIYDKWSFVPALGSIPEGTEVRVIDPPVSIENDDGGFDCSAVGYWMTRPKSAGGFICSAGTISDGDPLVIDELYRYIGNNYSDPFPGGSTTGDGALLNPYWDKFYQGRLNPANQQARFASRSGKVTSGTYFSLTQTGYDWWQDWANPGGDLRTESGTATAGSTTYLTDGSKNTEDDTLEHSCWWKNDGDPRYTGTTTAYEGFILQVDQSRTLPDPDPTVLAGDPTATVSQTVTFKVPISVTSNGSWGVKVEFEAFQIPKYNAADQTWTWENFTVHNGDAYRIIEPKYEINKWKGRTVTVTAPDGSIVLDEEPILYSDGNTLYFAVQADPVPVGSSFFINEKQPGVYRWTGTEFVIATGTDAARVTVQTAYDFLPDPNANNNGWVKDYGIIEYGDLMHIQVLNELWKAITLLYDTRGGLSWTSREDPETLYKNKRSAGAQLPFWTEDPTQTAYLTSLGSDFYHSSDGAWARAWSAIFDQTDTYNRAYGSGTDPLSEDPTISPRQYGSYEFCYAYVDHWEEPGYYYGGCNNAVFYDDGVLNAYIEMVAAEAWGVVAPQAGFRKLGASISGVVYSAIAPDDPDQSDFDADNDRDYCTELNRAWESAQFTDAGSGALYRKWHIYNSWSVSAGTTGSIIGPKYGSRDFLGDPEVKRRKCRDQTCTYTDGSGTHSYKPFEQFDDLGQAGWCVIDQFVRIHWDMEGY